MSNVISIRTRQSVTLAPPPIIALAPMPSWVTGNATLNRVVTNLQLSGWTVIDTSVAGMETLECYHPRVKPVPYRPLGVYEALGMQRILGAVKV